MKFTKWQDDLLRTLGWRLRVVSFTQLSKDANVSRRAIKQRLRAIEIAGYVGSMLTPIHHWEILHPLVVWPSDTWDSDFTGAAWQLEKRWKNLRLLRDTILWLTRIGAAHMGTSGGGLRQPLQVQHDLGVAAVYFSLSQKYRRRWAGEDFLRQLGGVPGVRRIPDAGLTRDGRLETLIEFGGQYDRKKLNRFHQAAKRGAYRYEIY